MFIFYFLLSGTFSFVPNISFLLTVGYPPHPHPCGSVGKESACNVGDLGSIPGLGRSPGEGKGYPLQYSGLENTIDESMRSKRVGHFHFHPPHPL